MKYRTTVNIWLLMVVFGLFWASGMTVGYTMGIARADNCSGWNGRFIQSTTCDGYPCQGFSLGPLWTSNCAYNAPPVYPPPVP